MNVTDRIEKTVDIAAPPSRVWKALTDHEEFGAWFGVKLKGPFVVGQAVGGVFDALPPAEVIAELQRKAGLEPAPIQQPPTDTFCVVEKLEPERLFAFRWVPYGIDAGVDPQTEPMTLVELRLEPRQGGTRLTISESGFDRVPAHRRARAFLMNSGGWAAQAENVKKHVETH